MINTLGYIVAFSVFRKVHHTQIAHYLTKKTSQRNFENLYLSHGTFNDLVWRRSDKEFELNGNLYDVLTINHQGDSVLIVCYKDNHEKKMESHYAKHLSPTSSDKSSPESQLVAKLSQNYLYQPFIKQLENEMPSTALQVKDYFHYSRPFSSPHIRIYSPPPNGSLVG